MDIDAHLRLLADETKGQRKRRRTAPGIKNQRGHHATSATAASVTAELEHEWKEMRAHVIEMRKGGASVISDTAICPQGLSPDTGLDTRGTRVAMVYYRSRAMEDAELCMFGLKQVHIYWSTEEDGGMTFEFDAFSKGSQSTLDNVLANLRAAPSADTCISLHGPEAVVAMAKIAYLGSNSGKEGLRVLGAGETDHMCLAWDAPKVDALPPISEWGKE